MGKTRKLKASDVFPDVPKEGRHYYKEYTKNLENPFMNIEALTPDEEFAMEIAKTEARTRELAKNYEDKQYEKIPYDQREFSDDEWALIQKEIYSDEAELTESDIKNNETTKKAYNSFEFARTRNFAIVAHVDHGKSSLSDMIITLCEKSLKKRNETQTKKDDKVTTSESNSWLSAEDKLFRAVINTENTNENDGKEIKTAAKNYAEQLTGSKTTQSLDSLAVEKERGITVKASTIRLEYQDNSGKTWFFNLIDTPGHADFRGEVLRSLAATDGVILLIDSSQGVQAGTTSYAFLALEKGLSVLPVLSKADLPSSEPERIKRELIDVLGISTEPFLVSAKTGEGVSELLDAIVKYLPPPVSFDSFLEKVATASSWGDTLNNPSITPFTVCESDLQQQPQNEPIAFSGYVFDSFYDNFKGAALIVRVHSGSVSVGDIITTAGNSNSYKVTEVGYLTTNGMKSLETGNGYASRLREGCVGYIFAGIKSAGEIKIPTTITISKSTQKIPTVQETPAFTVSTVEAGIFPLESGEYGALRTALEKLSLADGSLTTSPTSSLALGRGFRCGFLGILHSEIIIERLRGEYGLEVTVTAPSVVYKITMETTPNELTVEYISDPNAFPTGVTSADILSIEEPYVKASIIFPTPYIGKVMELAASRRGKYLNTYYWTRDDNPCLSRAELTYELPLAEIIYDFVDALNSATKGYASYEYDFLGGSLENSFRQTKISLLEILVAGESQPELSLIVHRDSARSRGVKIIEKLKDELPRQLFDVAIQARVDGGIVARENVRALRKDVLAKCYGGDITRKKKLLEKQKEGKKRMARTGSVDIPPEAIIACLKGGRSN